MDKNNIEIKDKSMEIYSLQVNHLHNPMGYEMQKTVFSWKIRNAKGKKQTAARIRIGGSIDLKSTDLIVDTGFSSELSSLAATVDIALLPCKRYYWDVTVRSDQDEEVVSEVQWFETGKMNEPWVGKWISCDNNETRHPIFKKKIILNGEVRSARLYICGLGVYEAFYDDKRIGDEYLAPYCNDHNQSHQDQSLNYHGQLWSLIPLFLI